MRNLSPLSASPTGVAQRGRAGWLLALLALSPGLAAAQVPALTSFAPASGPVGTSVTITGSGFSATAGQNVVYFGAVQAPVTAASATSLTVTVPTSATYQPLSVTNLASRLTTYSAQPFLVTLKGSIAFRSRVDYTLSPTPFSANTADLDGDGKPDVAAAIFGSSAVAVYRNASTVGTVNLPARVNFATGTQP